MSENTNPIALVYTRGRALPVKKYPTDAGFDLTAISVKRKGSDYIYETNAHLILPRGYEAEVRPRSSIRDTDLFLRNAPGTIDPTYTGNVIVTMRLTRPTHSLFAFLASFFKKPKVYKVGDRIAQLVIKPVEVIELKKVNTEKEFEAFIEEYFIETLVRGDRGHGSTNI